MSQSDSFIDEVTDEVRRDRFFAFIRRWFWVAAVVIVLIVAAAAWNEWRKARELQQAQAVGDAIVAALSAEDPAARAQALAAIDAGEAEAMVDLLIAAETAGSDTGATALTALDAQAGRADLSERWQDLAGLKLILLQTAGTAPSERIAQLEPLTIPGAPYRLLALEQVALSHVSAGDEDQALPILQDILADEQATEALRRRASQLIVALGGELAAG